MPKTGTSGGTNTLATAHALSEFPVDIKRRGDMVGTEFLGLKIASADLSPEPGMPFPLMLEVSTAQYSRLTAYALSSHVSLQY